MYKGNFSERNLQCDLNWDVFLYDFIKKTAMLKPEDEDGQLYQFWKKKSLIFISELRWISSKLVNKYEFPFY